MGTSYTAAQFSGKIFKTAKNLKEPAVKKRFMAQAMADMDKIFVKQVYSDLHKDHFTNWPREHSKLTNPGALHSVKKAAIKSRNYKPADQPQGLWEEYVFTVESRSFGPLWVAEYGRHRDPKTGMPMHGPMQGPMITKGSHGTENGWHKNRKISRKKRKKWNGATKPMHTWGKATNRMEWSIPRQIETEFTKIMFESFK